MSPKRRKPTKVLYLEPSQLKRLNQIAAGFGLLVGRGPTADEGSIDQLAAGIADGELIVVTKAEYEQLKAGKGGD